MPLLARALRPVSLDLTPVEVAARLRHLPGLVFFDSAREGAENGQLSIIAARPVTVLDGHLDHDRTELESELRKRQTALGADDGMPRGFAAGWVEYDGAFCFGIYEEALIFCHAAHRWYELGELRSELREPDPTACPEPLRFSSRIDRERYLGMVVRAQEYIAAGDIYQVNLAHRLIAEWSGDPFAFYHALRHYSPAPQAAFLDLGGRQILSSSPETFLKISGRTIQTRPIKGTRPRKEDPKADEKSAYDLITSAKEIAELVMITDLERNDLGQICDYGSVVVRELLKLERHEQVFHLVSTVTGSLRPEIDHFTALRACFPGGSITGAPKHRAREIIAELEPARRGLYTGSIGWFGFNGESRFNLAIRTVVIEGNSAQFHVGAGIVADSNPAREWQETLQKASGILLAAERFGEKVDALRRPA
jgi:para-aminobenzoate synthetase component 1